MMKWKRDTAGHYLSDDGRYWIHRYWVGDDVPKSAVRTMWTVCIAHNDEWWAEHDCYTLSAAKRWAENRV